MTEIISSTAKAGRYLSFLLDEETYALSIESVSEINGICSITPIPHTPPFLKGVIDLRGKVIPVVDLRTKFGMAPAAYNKETCIIVVEGEEGNIGVIVDTVKEVIDLGATQIEKPPQLGDEERTKFISGIGKLQNEIIIVIDISKVLSKDEMRGAMPKLKMAS